MPPVRTLQQWIQLMNGALTVVKPNPLHHRRAPSDAPSHGCPPSTGYAALRKPHRLTCSGPTADGSKWKREQRRVR